MRLLCRTIAVDVSHLIFNMLCFDMQKTLKSTGRGFEPLRLYHLEALENQVVAKFSRVSFCVMAVSMGTCGLFNK